MHHSNIFLMFLNLGTEYDAVRVINYTILRGSSSLNVGCTLKDEQPLRLLFNLFFYHFDRSEPAYKSQRIKPHSNNCHMQSIKCGRCIIIWQGHLIFGEISQTDKFLKVFSLQAVKVCQKNSVRLPVFSKYVLNQYGF